MSDVLLDPPEKLESLYQKPIICQKYVSCMYLPQETIQIATHDS